MDELGDFARLYGFRALVLTALGAVAILLPLSGIGAFAVQAVVPGLLGWLVFRPFPERSIGLRCWLLASLVGGVSTGRLCWEAALNGWDFSFDGEWDLVLAFVGLQFIFATFGFVAAWFYCRKPIPAARQGCGETLPIAADPR
jgi:hypothetical protein